MTDWNFSTNTQCSECLDSPDSQGYDYWQMAKVKGKWVCALCLGKMVTGLDKKVD